jgi:hypothetical protein
MRTIIPLQSQALRNPALRVKTSRKHTSRKSLPPCVQTPLVVLAAAAAFLGAQLQLGAQALAAQTPATPSAPAPLHKPAHKPVHPHAPPSPAHALTPPAPAVPAPITPPAPELPHWPVNEKPDQASVTWDSQGLRIDAANSSLQQILKDVSTATGVKVEGMGSDERIFGAYGPGQARDVLSQLLQGSGYNVLMIGDQGQGTPRQIVLTARNTGPEPAKTGPATPEEDAEAEDQPQQGEPRPANPPYRPNFGPGGPHRTPPQNNPQTQQPNNPPN